MARDTPIIARQRFWALVFVYCGGSEEGFAWMNASATSRE
jgi:hypothetical protein